MSDLRTTDGAPRGRGHGRPRVTSLSLCLAVGLALAALLLLPGTGTAQSSSPAPAGSPGNGLTYRIGIASGVDNMNPFSTYMTLPWECFRVCYNFLTWYDDKYEPVPDLADPVPTVANGGITDNGKVWTFHLRPNVKWSDGVPLTANDVAYTFNRILRQQLGMYIGYFTNVTKVQATDASTVVITCSKPNSVLTALYVPILPEHIWNKVPDGKVDTWANVPMVSSGPFQVAEVQHGKFVRLERNPYYKDGFGVEPTVQTVLFDIYTEASSLVNDYKVGAIDAALDLDPGFYAPLKSVSGSKLTDSPALGFHEMGMNCYQSPKSKGNPLLLDVKVRQAICYAIDKPTIAKTAMDGLAPVASSLLSPVQSEFRWVVPEDQVYAFDPAKAKQILDAAGYKMGSNGVRVAPNGKPLSLRLNAITDYPMDVSAAKMIAGYLKDVGIGIKLDITDEGAFTDLNYDNANDDLYLWNWNADIDPGYILSTFTSGQLLNGSDSEYSNPQYDKLYVQQAEATDPAQRKAIIEQMQQILYRDAPYAILWYNVNIQAFRTDRWTGYDSVPPGGDGAALRNMMRTTYINLKPVTESGGGGGGVSSGLIAGIVIAVLVVAGIVVAVVARRRKKAVEVE